MKESFADFINRTRKGKKRVVKTKDISRKANVYFEIESMTTMQQENNPEKYFIIERLRRTKIEGKLANPKDANKIVVEYRIGYYIVGKNGRMDGKWTWGQYTPMIPINDFWGLINKAKEEGTILDEDLNQ
ncbi:hypothetical protein [Rhodohalobacter barkolensis]|uniref:Uncharacterized protein n=1 Tax=Rhodohalobacter barkolensis TaxID=2053187 RepID=A0A2N0VGZ0_9BACT|nr:hypothetical protein [Rhodohalobacter barkolensis]PKD43466.1 hypothetical protein CWD77_07800 [Rhodohalobacter barkolensis]